MTSDSDRHFRRSIRLKGYDYSQAGAYFVTICARDRACLFGEAIDGQVFLNLAGRIVEQCWLEIPDHYPHVELDAYIVMPDHVHGIIVVTNLARNVGANKHSPTRSAPSAGANDHSPVSMERAGFRSPSKTIGSVVRGFKIGVTKWLRQNTDVVEVWQRGYYEHIIRDEESLDRIRLYIADNPANWETDL